MPGYLIDFSNRLLTIHQVIIEILKNWAAVEYGDDVFVPTSICIFLRLSVDKVSSFLQPNLSFDLLFKPVFDNAQWIQ